MTLINCIYSKNQFPFRSQEPVQNRIHLSEEEEVNSKEYFFLIYSSSIFLLPGMCVKAYRVTNNEKIFINICTSDGIPAPEDISADQLTEILLSETPSNYKIPMSITELRLIPDKSGKDAVACDVAVHPNYFRKIDALRVFREFLITIVFEALDTKYNVQVNRDTWIVLKNRKCMGTLVKHRVQNRDVQKVYESYQNPTKEHKTLINVLKGGEQIEYKQTNYNSITEISTKRGASDTNGKISTVNLTKLNNAQNNNSRKPDCRLYKTNEAASQLLVAEFFLPEVIDATEILLDLNVDRLVLESRRFGYLFDSFVPSYIDVNASMADFNRVHRVRRILEERLFSEGTRLYFFFFHWFFRF